MPLEAPERAILGRLGFDGRLTRLDAAAQRHFLFCMRAAFQLCRPVGRYVVAAIRDNDGTAVTLADGRVFRGRDFAACIGNADRLWVAAATVGPEIVRGIAACGEDMAAAAIYDATASETTDAALDFLQDYARRQLARQGNYLQRRRFSPGYGELTLEAQRDIFELLRLDELGLRLTPELILAPEKSVTAFAGIATDPDLTAKDGTHS